MLKDKKKIFKIIFLFIFIFMVGFIGVDIGNYIKYQKIVKATGGMPWQDGAASVTMYQPVCVATPPDGVCKNCLMCGPKTGNYECASHEEIQLVGQGGTTEICPLQGFVYSGGGVKPIVGEGIIAGGASNILPWVIGVPGASVERVGRVKKIYNNIKDFVIAGFK